MTFAEVLQTVDAALARTPFSISGAALSSTPITQLLTAQLGSDELVLTGATKTSSDATSVTVTGTAAAAFRGFPEPTFVAVFTCPGAVAEVAISVTGATAGWTVSTAFPALAGSVFDSFAYASPTFTLASTDAPVLPADFPAGCGMAAYPGATAAALVTGLSFSADATPEAGVASLSWLVGGSWSLSGPVETTGSLPSMLLSGTAGTPIQLAGFSVGFALTLASMLQLPPDGSAPSGVTGVIQLEADVDETLSTGKLRMPIVARAFSPAMEPLSITGDLDQLSRLAVGDLSTLLGTTVDLSPPAGFPSLDDIGVRSVALIVSPANKALVSATVTIAIMPGAGETWSTFGGMIVFGGMEIAVSYVPGSGVDVSVTGSGQVAGGTLDGGFSLPDTDFFLKLVEPDGGGDPAGPAEQVAAPAPAPQGIDIAAIVKQASGGTIAMPQVVCTSLDFSGSVSDDAYRFQAVVTDDWSFSLGSTPLAITQVGMDLSYAASGAGLSGEVIGSFEIGGATLFASASYDPTAKWTFAGGTQGSQTISITAVVADVLAKFGVTLSGTAPDVELENLNISFNTASSAFNIKGASSMTIAGTTFDVGVQFGKDADGAVFNGYLWIDDFTVELDFSVGSSTVIAGSFVAGEGAPEPSLQNLLGALGFGDRLPRLPSSLNPTLTGAGLVYDVTNDVLAVVADLASGATLLVVDGKTGRIGFVAEATASLNLSDLPLVGARLADVATVSVDKLQISVASAPLAAAGAAFNAELAGFSGFLSRLTVPTFPALPAGATTQAYLQGELDYGAGTLPLDVALDGGSTGSGGGVAASAPSTGGGGSATASTTSDGTTWFSVQRSFGPITIQRIGAFFQSSAQTLWFELDASLAVGPLSVQLDGLGMGSPISDFSPSFTLGGLGVGYSAPPLTIAGSLVNLAPPGASYLEFEGGVTIGTGEFSITAFGYYGNKSSFPSMFLFGDIAYDFGGPPAFFVTGLALGFGYNSGLRVPTIDEVGTFPFVEVLPTSALPNPGVFGSNPTPLDVLDTVLAAKPPWVTPTRDALWFAAGITFTSFELVNSQALVLVEPGQNLTVALLGTSRAQFPQPIPGEQLPVYASIELDLEVVFAPFEGVFSVEAVLSRTSFLLDPACALTGGFAFYVWFGPSPHAGDFVVTLGGYHPAFTPPDYYPAVPRVGFHWSLDSSITIQGGAYFAVTPAAMMVGGSLSATYQTGNLKAWFDAHADVLIRWKPFWIAADVGITIGASYRLDLLFTTATVSVELGCDLLLWGPPTGGSVGVDWYVISFTIPFGNQDPKPPVAADWAAVEAMLPSNGTGPAQPITIAPRSGLHPASTTPPASTRSAGRAEAGRASETSPPAPAPAAPWTVRGSFSFTTSSTIPATAATVGGSTFAGSRFDVFPLAGDPAWRGVSASHAVTIEDPGGTDMSAHFAIVPNFTAVPASLWGAPPTDAQGNPQVPSGADQLVGNQLIGLTIAVNPAQIGATPGPVDLTASLAFDVLSISGTLPLSAAAGPVGDIPVYDATALATIFDDATGIQSAAAGNDRDAALRALAALGYAPTTANDPMSGLAAMADRLFASPPLVVT